MAPADAVIPVSRLLASARRVVERELGLAWVSGEISGFTRAASGHCYFNLKDAQAQVRCVFFRTKAQFVPFALKDGLQVELRAVPTIYEAKGEFQLNVDAMRLAGIGALYERFGQLKAKLEAAGWFRQERKRPVPAHPRAVGIVTSLQAAALRDVLTTLRRRWPALPVVIYPASVQGGGAAPDIARALALANTRNEVDVLIVCRGGGSIEDLWAFNEEAVALAVYNSVLPVISGVGHETDFTICDFVADVRAPTPTAAAALAAPDGPQLRRTLALHAGRLRQGMCRALEARAQRLDHAGARLTHPRSRLRAQLAALAEHAGRLRRASTRTWVASAGETQRAGARLLWQMRQPLPACLPLASTKARLLTGTTARLAALDDRLAHLTDNLAHLNPDAVLERGYAIVATEDGRIVTAAADLALGDTLQLRFAAGAAKARVTDRS